MNTALNIVAPPRPSFASAIEDAIGAIAPNWPLDRQIAVNPYWGFIDRTFEQAADVLTTLAPHVTSYFNDNSPHREIADRLGISINTVNAQMVIGLMRCRAYLRERGVLRGQQP